MTIKRFLHAQSGIALGPILFIIAMLAILGSVIAAGRGFVANTGTESAKAMAEAIVTSCDDYARAVQMMTMRNGCDPTALDFTPNGGGWPSGSGAWNTGDYTGGNGTNHAGNGQCALFDPRGGAMQFKPLPSAAMTSNPTGAYTTYAGGSATLIDAFAGYPFLQGNICIPYFGYCLMAGAGGNGALLLHYYYLSYPVCQQINNLLHEGDPNSGYNYADHFLNGLFAGTTLLSLTATDESINGYYNSSGCARGFNSNGGSSAYVYTCAVMIR